MEKGHTIEILWTLFIPALFAAATSHWQSSADFHLPYTFQLQINSY